jgi:hypothetical protein
METGEFKFKNELVKMKVDVEHAEFLFKRAVNIIKGEMPEPGEKCVFCKWRENGL